MINHSQSKSSSPSVASVRDSVRAVREVIPTGRDQSPQLRLGGLGKLSQLHRDCSCRSDSTESELKKNTHVSADTRETGDLASKTQSTAAFCNTTSHYNCSLPSPHLEKFCVLTGLHQILVRTPEKCIQQAQN